MILSFFPGGFAPQPLQDLQHQLKIMGKKTNGATNDSAPAAKTPSASARKRVGAKNGASKPAKKRVAVVKAAAAGAAAALTAGKAIAKLVRAPRAKRSTPPRTRAAGRGGHRPSYTRDDVALRAYFISERRRAEGLTGDPDNDWIEAERQLAAEFLR